MRKLRVSPNSRFLVHDDGSPFHWFGDIAWELFHRASREDAERYLVKRSAQRFSLVQAVVLAEEDGIRAPNAYGDVPLLDEDPARPNEEYFRHVDWIVQKANSLRTNLTSSYLTPPARWSVGFLARHWLVWLGRGISFSLERLNWTENYL